MATGYTGAFLAKGRDGQTTIRTRYSSNDIVRQRVTLFDKCVPEAIEDVVRASL